MGHGAAGVDQLGKGGGLVLHQSAAASLAAAPTTPRALNPCSAWCTKHHIMDPWSF